MTIIEAINRTDALKQNLFSQEQKVNWLSKVESMIKRLVIDTHEGGENAAFTGYDKNTPTETVLIVPEPYDELYLRFLEAQIDYHNREISSYNMSVELFDAAYQSFADFYNRTHLPKCGKKSFF